MTRTLYVTGRVTRQLLHDRRLLALSILAPFVIVYFFKLFFDTMPPGFPVARYAMPIDAFLVHFLAFLLCALVLVQERTGGTLERMFINGYRREEVIGGYVLGYLGLATVQALVALVEAVLLFNLRYSAPILLQLLLVVWLLALASVLLGIFVSTFARHEGQVFPFVPLIILPSVFLSGLLVTVNRLPGWAQVLSHLLPLYYANNAIQEIILPAGNLLHQAGSLAVLCAYSVVLLFLASRTLSEVE